MIDQYKQYKVLAWAFSFLKSHDREEQVAEILLQHHLDVNRATFYARMRESIPADIYLKFQSDIRKHVKTGVPVQHLTEHESFYGRTFHVNSNVLVPRMETEELVSYVIEQVKSASAEKPRIIADIGTGSGVIATTLALELPQSKLYATDISEAALTVAQENAKRLRASVQFCQGNFVQPLIDKQVEPDIIVSNPPYISERERDKLSDTVEKFDPALALFAKEDGLGAYQAILSQVKKDQLKPQMICFEIGYNQKEAVTKLSEQHFPERTVKCIQDINGNDRIIAIFL